MARTLTAYASAYQPDRVHVSRVMRGQKRTVTVSFAGVMPAGATIASAVWRNQSGYPLFLETAAIVGKLVTVRMTARQDGIALLKCEATLSNGDVLTQIFRIESEGNPYFTGETNVAGVGPQTLSVTA